MIFQDGDRIVFVGDSVTDMGSINPVGEGAFDSLGHGYVRVIDSLLTACYPELSIRVTNSGISGNTTRDILARLDRDVISLKPDWVSICIGINDVWRQFDNPTIFDLHISPEEYEENLEKILVSIKDGVKGIFMLTPFYIEPCRADAMRARMDEYVTICKKLSDKYNCIYVDFQKLYEDFCQIRHSASIAWDRVHPNQIGATLMARAFLDKCGFDYYHGMEK